MTETELVVNTLIETPEKNNTWKDKLASATNRELYSQYNGALAWFAATSNEDALDITDAEHQKLNEVLQFLEEETRIRAKQFLENTKASQNEVLQALLRNHSIEEEDFKTAELHSTVADYLVLVHTISTQEPPHANTRSQDKKRNISERKIIASAAVALLLAACNPVHIEHSATKVQQTAVALPSNERQSVKETQSFSAEEIDAVKHATVRIFIPTDGKTDEYFPCTARFVINDNQKRFLFLAKHCFINTADQDLTDIRVKYVQAFNPQENNPYSLTCNINRLYYIPGKDTSDFIALELSDETDISELNIEPVNINQVIPDYEPEKVEPVLLSSYPSITYKQRVLQLQESTINRSIDNTPAYHGTKAVFTMPRLHVLAGETSSGGSGGSADIKKDDRLHYIGVITSIKEETKIAGTTLNNAEINISPVPGDLLTQMKNSE